MAHTSSLRDPRIEAALDRMFAAAERDAENITGMSLEAFAAAASLSASERAEAASRTYLPVSREGGTLLYNVVRAIRPTTVVEFGMSFGISTLYLAAAVRDNGTGLVVTTELSGSKVAAARRTFAETGLDEVIAVLEGDALTTLAEVDAEVGLVLLDGWKDLYLPVLRLLEPRLTPGALVIADDVAFPSLKPYLEFVRDPANGYECVTFPVGDGMELCCRCS